MPIVRLPNGDLRDEIRQPLYDTISIGGASVNYVGKVGNKPSDLNNQSFFSNIQGKEQWQTNLRQPNLLETAVSFRVQGMSLDAQYINVSPTAFNQFALPSIMDFGSLRLHIGEKDYWTGSLVYVMGRVEQNGAISHVPEIQCQCVAAPATDVGFLYQRAGAQAVQGVVLSGRHVVDINPLQSFYAVMLVSQNITAAADAVLPASDAINMKLSLKGLQRRPVQ